MSINIRTSVYLLGVFLFMLAAGCFGSPPRGLDEGIDPGILMSALDAGQLTDEQSSVDVAQWSPQLGKDSVTFEYGGLLCELYYLKDQKQYLGVASGQVPPTFDTYFLFDAAGTLLSTNQVGWKNLPPTLKLGTWRAGTDEDLLIRWEDSVMCRTTKRARILSMHPDGFHSVAEIDEQVNTCPDYDGMDAVYGRFETTTWSFTDTDADGVSELLLHRVKREGPKVGDWGAPTGSIVSDTMTVLYTDDRGRAALSTR